MLMLISFLCACIANTVQALSLYAIATISMKDADHHHGPLNPQLSSLFSGIHYPSPAATSGSSPNLLESSNCGLRSSSGRADPESGADADGRPEMTSDKEKKIGDDDVRNVVGPRGINRINCEYLLEPEAARTSRRTLCPPPALVSLGLLGCRAPNVTATF